MKAHVVLGALAVSALVSVGCERRDGQIIIHEGRAREKVGEGVKKAGEGVKTLGEKTEELGEKARERAREDRPAPPKGTGGGPHPEACDAGATVDCPPSR